jgi:hypothetical protein
MIPIVTALLPMLGTILDRVIPDKAASEKAKLEMQAALLDAAVKGDLGQMEINKAEATHQSIFVAGWRPAVGWICASALAYSYIVVPLVSTTLTLMGKPVVKLPVLDANLWELMAGMLGMGALRSWDKAQALKK